MTSGGEGDDDDLQLLAKEYPEWEKMIFPAAVGLLNK
jgi:hypothetical protein